AARAPAAALDGQAFLSQSLVQFLPALGLAKQVPHLLPDKHIQRRLSLFDLPAFKLIETLPIFGLLLAFQLVMMSWYLFPPVGPLKGAQAPLQLFVVHSSVPCRAFYWMHPVHHHVQVFVIMVAMGHNKRLMISKP